MVTVFKVTQKGRKHFLYWCKALENKWCMSRPHRRHGIWGVEVKITFIYVCNGKSLSGRRIKRNFWRLGLGIEVWAGLSLDLQEARWRGAHVFCIDVPSCFNEAYCIITLLPFCYAEQSLKYIFPLPKIELKSLIIAFRYIWIVI